MAGGLKGDRVIEVSRSRSRSGRWARSLVGWDGQERRSPESLAARELAVLKAQGDKYEGRVALQSKKKRRRAERSLALVRARERQLLEMLGATRHDV